jgi:hypothetical protein
MLRTHGVVFVGNTLRIVALAGIIVLVPSGLGTSREAGRRHVLVTFGL